MTGPIDTLRTVADTLGQAHVHPVKVQVTAHHNGPIVDILTATRTDLFALCDTLDTKHPEPAQRRPETAAHGQLHYSVIARNGWLLRCVSFPHHPDRQDQP